MNSKKTIIFAFLILFFLSFSFSPTIFELSRANQLKDLNREFILEHNYYWPDFNLYLSKIRQGYEGRFTALERYTSEKHQGSLIQEFYVILGQLGRILKLDPNFSYQLGRVILSPLLLLVILKLVQYYFPPSQPTNNSPNSPSYFKRGLGGVMQILAFLIVVTSGSFPRFYTDSQGILQVGRFMEWWSNIDSLQRITFIPHILFGQVVSFFLLYQLVIKQFNNLTLRQSSGFTPRVHPEGQAMKSRHKRDPAEAGQFIFFILLGNAVGLAFPPSLITLIGVLLIIIFFDFIKKIKTWRQRLAGDAREGSHVELHRRESERLGCYGKKEAPFASDLKRELGIPERQDPLIILFILLSLPSLLYFLIITKQLPWSALVDFHRTHSMMVPFDQYLLGTGPIFFLGVIGAIVSIIKREKHFQPLILWVIVTLGFAAIFSLIKEQSPLRFTQTGLFIPLGILGAYFFYQLFLLGDLGYLGNLGRSLIKTGVSLLILFYLLGNLYIMKLSLTWQTSWISQRLGANIPAVPYPPQTMYPLNAWMDGIRWLRDNTNRADVVLAEITAGNYIPAYAGNTVYFGQANTVDYDRKQLEVERFFSGQMTSQVAKLFLKNGRIKYVFFSVQEKERAGAKNLEEFYPFAKTVYRNKLVTIYSY